MLKTELNKHTWKDPRERVRAVRANRSAWRLIVSFIRSWCTKKEREQVDEIATKTSSLPVRLEIFDQVTNGFQVRGEKPVKYCTLKMPFVRAHSFNSECCVIDCFTSWLDYLCWFTWWTLSRKVGTQTRVLYLANESTWVMHLYRYLVWYKVVANKIWIGLFVCATIVVRASENNYATGI